MTQTDMLRIKPKASLTSIAQGGRRGEGRGKRGRSEGGDGGKTGGWKSGPYVFRLSFINSLLYTVSSSVDC